MTTGRKANKGPASAFTLTMHCHILVLVFIMCFLLCILPLSRQAALSSSHIFTFSQSQSFLKVTPDWPLPETRTVSFRFRTERPNGLLLYHGSSIPTDEFSHYELYLMLENGRLKIIHVYYQDGRKETFHVGKGLNRDHWHQVVLKIIPDKGVMNVIIDDTETTFVLQSLLKHPNYGLAGNQPEAFLYFGGLDPNSPLQNQKYNYVRFVGCLGDIQFSYSDGDMKEADISVHSQLKKGCINLCDKQGRCLHGGVCVNHYTYTSCDCFGTGHEDKTCYRSNPTTVTLRGYSHLTYRIYDWKDRVQSEVNRLSITFKMYVPDAVLLYGAGEHPTHNYLAVSVSEGKLYFEINFGDGVLNATFGYQIHNKQWHTLNVFHRGKQVHAHLDNQESVTLETSGDHHHLHLDPEIYIGAAPPNAQGLHSQKRFVGCLKSLYFNDKNILFAFADGDKAVRHHGVFSAEFGCAAVDVIPLTFPLADSKIVLAQPSKIRLQLSLEFKTAQKDCVLASGEIRTEKGKGYWEIHLVRGVAFFTIVDDEDSDSKDHWSVIEGKQLFDAQWHQVGVTFDSGEVKLEIDYRFVSTSTFTQPLEFSDKLAVATSIRNPEQGLVGCMRDIFVNGEWIDPRSVVGSEYVVGKVSLDNCQLVDPCRNPQACEHGGRCYLEHGEVFCDCTNTGYTGKTCHFSLYKRTCEELYLVGYRESGVYKIDIDRNGLLPPAHVHCDMGDGGGSIATKVENNMTPEMVIRKLGMKNFYLDVTYREFTPIMLQSLIHHSKQCFQIIKYECFKTPVGLRTFTWMYSSAKNHLLTSIGSKVSGHCQCAETRSCANETLLCNCDSGDERWRVDEGVYTASYELGVTRIYVLQPPNLENDAEGRLSLGPLECVETDTQQYVITFKTSLSYLEVPGWRSGDMAFSFRTSNSKAVLIYQASVHTAHGYLRVLLVSDHELSFEFTVNGKPLSVKVASQRKLNSGEWQQVSVDHDTHHMRFTVNLDSSMIDLGEDEEVGPFEGPLYVGGVPEHHAGDSKIREGFIGCFRGLVINDAVVDLYKHMTRSGPDIVTGCQPSCSPNPCQNGATCLEFWGSYYCQCANPVAHSGKNCEYNINIQGITFLTSNSFYHHKTKGNKTSPVLQNDILLSFRTYQQSALLLYAFDHFNNFVQLHFDEKAIYFTFNSARNLYQVGVEVPGITKGFQIQVKVQRHLDETQLIVNSKQASVKQPINFVSYYYQKPWLDSMHLEKVFPPRGSFQTVEHSEMFLGYVGSGTRTNFSSFVGCLQGLKVGDSVFDLDAAATSVEPDAIHGSVRPGCKMHCDKQPCYNGGVCIEHWKNNYTTCDCALTSYTGDICQKDIGGIFDGKSAVRYSFVDAGSDPSAAIVRLAFSTESSVEFQQILLLVHFAQSSRYILLALTPESSLLVEEYRGISGVVKKVVKPSSSLIDGNRHWIYYSRKNNSAILVVDGKEYIPVFQNSQEVDTNGEGTANLLMVGGARTKDPRFEEYGNFKGCISNVIVDLGELHMMPLETAFGYQKGALERVKVEGGVSEKKCAGFKEIVTSATPAPRIPPEITGPKWIPEPPIQVPYTNIYMSAESDNLEATAKASVRTAVVMGILLLVVISGVMIYVWWLQKRHKRYQRDKEYHFLHEKRRGTGIKAVSFGGLDSDNTSPYISETQPLTASPVNNFHKRPTKTIEEAPEEEDAPDPDLKPESIKNKGTADVMEMAPLRPTSSQELEWDPAADNAELITTAMNEIDPDDSDPETVREATDLDGPLPNKSTFAPLASTSEVTINRLSQTFA